MNKDNVRKLLNICSKEELIELIFEIQKYSRSEFALNEFVSLKIGKVSDEIHDLTKKVENLREEIYLINPFQIENAIKIDKLEKQLKKAERKLMKLYETLNDIYDISV
ncbi:hypothetical protein [Faecalibacillus faecis]|jgi:uncharacterized protein YqgV (UPF0045/DUF77 family)|uniref:hypothetical protein n=1 Tax=Faecalibacillus faecis TaxID=1982628 RepID=UPI003866CE30